MKELLGVDGNLYACWQPEKKMTGRLLKEMLMLPDF